jgi:nucleotide-binding universal stress UspA family protein
MFKRILIPTDGSELSGLAVEKGLDLAKEVGAEVTAVHVGTPLHLIVFDPEDLSESTEQYEIRMRRKGEEILHAIQRTAEKKGVACKISFSTSDHPYEDIIKAAEANGCDLILMASHGRKGVKGLLLGSETQKVLTHSAIPVLVYRQAQPA